MGSEPLGCVGDCGSVGISVSESEAGVDDAEFRGGVEILDLVWLRLVGVFSEGGVGGGVKLFVDAITCWADIKEL